MRWACASPMASSLGYQCGPMAYRTAARRVPSCAVRSMVKGMRLVTAHLLIDNLVEFWLIWGRLIDSDRVTANTACCIAASGRRGVMLARVLRFPLAGSGIGC